MPFVEFQSIRKEFAGHSAVADFSLDVAEGEFVSFLGPSGCGKTTTLRMLAGFESPTSGTIRIAGQDVTHVPTARRQVGMVFQAYALFPNMTVARNVAFGLRVAGMPGIEAANRVKEMLDLVQLGHLAARYPVQLSGGQQQRVALARALAPRPRILLLDEPLSALDARIRVELRDEIRALQRRLGITTIFVTHDQEEALSLSDRIVVMHDGRIAQIGTPVEIYNAPRSRFVASFVGTTNILDATILDAATGTMSIDGQTVTMPHLEAANGPCTIAIRPEALRLGANGEASLSGTAEDVAFLGQIVRVRVRLVSKTLLVDALNDPGIKPPVPGENLTISFAARDLNLVV